MDRNAVLFAAFSLLSHPCTAAPSAPVQSDQPRRPRALRGTLPRLPSSLDSWLSRFISSFMLSCGCAFCAMLRLTSDGPRCDVVYRALFCFLYLDLVML
eukprot:scaffold109687_cov28-Tisochrysis_lutea.AAC.1